MTDSEIVKALECCTTKCMSCKDCPAFVKVDRSNCKKYFRGALDLIKRLQAENERLGNQTTTYITTILKLINEAERIRANRESAMQFAADIVAADKILKAEAHKEFAKRLEKRLYEDVTLFTQQRYIVVDHIEKLLKELEKENERRKN